MEKRINNTSPTKKQKDTFEKVINESKSVHSAMKEVYKSTTAENPKTLTQSKGWNQLLEEYISDDELAKVHKGLLKNKDWRARDAGLEKGYKLKGRYAPEKVEHSGDITLDDKTKSIALELLKKIKDE